MFRTPVRRRNGTPFGAAVHCVGEKTSRSCCRSEQRGNKLYWQGTRHCDQRKKAVYAKPSTFYTRPVGKSEKILPSLVQVRYLYQPGELKSGVKRVTDPIWSLKVYNIERSFTKPNQPVLYYLHNGPKRGFVREELLVVPPNTQLPPITHTKCNQLVL